MNATRVSTRYSTDTTTLQQNRTPGMIVGKTSKACVEAGIDNQPWEIEPHASQISSPGATTGVRLKEPIVMMPATL